MSLILLLLILSASPKASALYRAYELVIENTETGNERTVFSSMDHIQYPRYYPLAQNEIIRYVDSWMCTENMSFFKPICKKPDLISASLPQE